MPAHEDEELQLRSVALQNAREISLARQRAEEELLRTREALRESQERLQAALSAAGTGTFRWDVATNSLDWDSNLDGLFGLASGVSCHSLDEFVRLVHPDDRARLTGHHEESALRGTDLDLEFRAMWPNGTMRWIAEKGRAVFDPGGKPVHVTGACVDITRRKETEESLREGAQQLRLALSAAERVSEMKDEFLATLSHELRTPLNAIVGWADLLRRGPKAPADLARGLDTIERNARVQAQLIEDLLDMSRITSGKIRLDVQPLRPASFIESALEALRPAASAKGLAITVLLDPAAGPVSGDPGRLQQVAWNLISNAIKFTPRGGKIEILLQRVSSHIEIRVSDTGIGIKPEFIPHLFERFRQADASSARNFGGLGLGLSIVKSLVELHGGTVEIRSPGTGQGTAATVRLPLMVVQLETEAEQRPHPRGGSAADFPAVDLSGIKALVVDDQADARELIQRVLKDCGAETLAAASASEALKLVEAEKPQVIVCDIGMPETDGYEFLRRVRALGPEKGGNVPAVALTAFARSEDRIRALRAGFRVHISKPVNPSELVATVASVAGRVDPGEASGDQG